MPVSTEILEEQHPDYKDHIAEWIFADEAWNGGNAYIFKHLEQEVRESDNDFRKREAQAHLRNYAKAVTRIYINTLWGGSESVDRSALPESLQTASDSIDRRGRSASAFMQEVSQISILKGFCAILVQQSSDDDRAYWSIVSPENIINWDLDSDGNLDWLRIQDRERIVTPFEKGKVSVSYLTFTREGWARHDESGRDLAYFDENGNEIEPSQGEYNIIINGRPSVPVAFAYFEPRLNSLVGNTWFDDIARTNKAHFNLTSSLETAYRKSTMNLLARSIDGTSPPLNIEILKQSNILDYTGDVAPAFISPSTDSATEMREHLEELKRSIYEVPGLQIRDATTRQQSGISKAVDKNQAEEQVQAWASHLQDAENMGWKLTEAWRGRQLDAGVAYPTRFNILFEADALDRFERIRGTYEDIAPSVVQEQAMGTYQQLNPQASEDLLSTIEAEIEAELTRRLQERTVI